MHQTGIYYWVFYRAKFSYNTATVAFKGILNMKYNFQQQKKEKLTTETTGKEADNTKPDQPLHLALLKGQK